MDGYKLAALGWRFTTLQILCGWWVVCPGQIDSDSSRPVSYPIYIRHGDMYPQSPHFIFSTLLAEPKSGFRNLVSEEYGALKWNGKCVLIPPIAS